MALYFGYYFLRLATWPLSAEARLNAGANRAEIGHDALAARRAAGAAPESRSDDDDNDNDDHERRLA